MNLKPQPKDDAYQVRDEPQPIRDKANLPYNIHRHMDRMSAIISNPNLGLERYDWAIDHLLTLLEPYGDDTFNDKINTIRKMYDGEYNEKTGEKTIKGLIEKAKTSSGAEQLIRDRNQKILIELSRLIKRLRMGLEMEGTEEI
jgi:hypothetical protein